MSSGAGRLDSSYGVCHSSPVHMYLKVPYLLRYLSHSETSSPILRNQLPGDHQANLSSIIHDSSKGCTVCAFGT